MDKGGPRTAGLSVLSEETDSPTKAKTVHTGREVPCIRKPASHFSECRLCTVWRVSSSECVLMMIQDTDAFLGDVVIPGEATCWCVLPASGRARL